MSFLEDDEPTVDGHTQEDVDKLLFTLLRLGMTETANNVLMGLYPIRKPTDAFYKRLATTLPDTPPKLTSEA